MKRAPAVARRPLKLSKRFSRPGSGRYPLRAADRRGLLRVMMMGAEIGGEPRIGRADRIHEDGGAERDHEVARRRPEASEHGREKRREPEEHPGHEAER